jgi:hypothetical protein
MNGEPVVCDYCGAAVPADGLQIKVTRQPAGGRGRPDVVVIAACSEQHAAAYFEEERLPPPAPQTEAADRVPLGWSGRVGVGVAGLAVMVGWVLMGTGLYAVWRWLVAD